MLVYSPDEEALKFEFGGVGYLLPPNTESELLEEVALHAVKTLGMWGVCILTGDPVADADLKIKSEAKYRASVMNWALGEAEEYAKGRGPLEALGIVKKPSEDQAWAIEWLKRNVKQ